MNRRTQFNLGAFELHSVEFEVGKDFPDDTDPEEIARVLSDKLDKLLAVDYQRVYDITANPDSIIHTETFEPFIQKEEPINA